MRLIDADKLTNKIDAHVINNQDIMFIRKLINETETEEVAPAVHAHWVHDFIDANCNCGVEIHCGWVCSNCNWYAKMESKTNYCPDCGAKMDEEVQ